MLALDQNAARPDLVDRVVTVHWAYMEAIERVLGAPANSLYRTSAEAVRMWIGALGEGAG
jgi:hypothetical protein